MRELNAGEYLIDDRDELLRRQVAPALFDGAPMSTAFEDNQTGWMSTLRASVTPEDAYKRWTERDGNKSVGTYGILVADANDQGLPCVDDAESVSLPDHASVVSEGLGRGARKRISRLLRDAAVERGALFTP